MPKADDIRINDLGPVIRAAVDDVELVSMSFGFPPATPGGGPVFNFRSEGRSFANSNRCLIPASAFFEFTGGKSPKTKHRFALNDAPFMAIAGLWREQKGNRPPAFTMLTTARGPDVAPFHNRQIVVLRPDDGRRGFIPRSRKLSFCGRPADRCASRRYVKVANKRSSLPTNASARGLEPGDQLFVRCRV